MPAASVRERSLSLVSRDHGPPTLEDTLRAEIEQVSSGRYLRRGTTAVYVADALTGKPIVAMHETERLNPASNVKLISTATALSILGPGWRYLTRVLGPMPSPEGVVSGDIYLLGSFDPTLGTGHIQRMATDMADAGITRIDGSIRVGTNDERDGIDRPRLKIHVTGTEPGAAPRIELSPDNALARVEVKARTVKGKAGKRRQRPRIRIKTELVTGEDTGPYYRVEVHGRIPAGTRATYRRSISRGSLFGAHVLHAALGHAGITVTDPVRVRESELGVYMAQTRSFLPIELARHESLPLCELIARINKRSLNHLADRVVMSAGAALYGGPPTMAKAVRAMDEWLDEQAGIEPDGLVVDTGSGLSYKTQLTAQQIARVLRTAGGFISGNADPAQSELFEVFRDSLAVAGIDGTLRHRFRRSDAHGKVIGKTGTLTRVIALSGIVAESEQAMIFSIITNGHEHRRRSSVRKQHELIVEAVQRYLRRKMGNTAPADISDVAEFASAHGQGGSPGEDAEDDRGGGEDGVGIGTGGAGIGAVDISGISIGAAIGDLGIGSISDAIDGAAALTAP